LKLHPSLYPVLLLISKLRPPLRKNFEENFSIEPFLPYVKEFLGHQYYLVRSISTIALIPLVTIHETPLFISELFDDLYLMENSKTNEIHGHLMAISQFLSANEDHIKEKEIYNKWMETLIKSSFLFSSHCPIILQLFFEVFMKLFPFSTIDDKLTLSVNHFCINSADISKVFIELKYNL
jgi:hypothetical protein